MNTIDISYKDILEIDDEERIISFCLEVLDKLKITNWEISIMLCNDAVIKDLNNRYRSKNEPTDVLSFTQDLEPVGDIIYAGDIIISLETIEHHSKIFDASIDEEFKRVLIHGILHLSGMEHKTNSRKEEMLQIQEKILKSISGEKVI
ncbi:MAG: rRNA maturation RNase YbeY [Spirochaetales bacterium]|nr:rRNA maturation RNase YbeY [Spirochaetales bacterium]